MERKRESVPQESPEDGARREMLEALKRTTRFADLALFQRACDPNISEADFRAAIAEFNTNAPGEADTEEPLAARVGDVTIHVGGVRELRIERNMRGTFSLSSPSL